MRLGVAVFLLAAAPAFAQEYSLNLMVVGPKRYAFEGGASARNDGGAGIGLSLVRNLNDHFAVGAEATLSQFESPSPSFSLPRPRVPHWCLAAQGAFGLPLSSSQYGLPSSPRPSEKRMMKCWLQELHIERTGSPPVFSSRQ